MKLYPLKFEPIYKERLWGGNKLKTELNKNISHDFIGESWEISEVKDNVSVISNGALKGKTLTEIIASNPNAVLGKKVKNKFGIQFPILIKFIDAKKDLSIQLHPNDTLAMERHQSLGKTEMWYIMQAEKDAQLIAGFSKKTDKNSYIQAVESDRILDLLHQETIQEGDCFFIETGTIHAIGAGTLLAEIQQTSDVTYRIYDFKRKDKYGNYRELHTELALDAINFEQNTSCKKDYDTLLNTANPLVYCPYFSTQYLPLNQGTKKSYKDLDSFVIYVCVSGSAIISNVYGTVSVRRGESILLPADSEEITIDTEDVCFLEVYIPD